MASPSADENGYSFPLTRNIPFLSLNLYRVCPFSTFLVITFLYLQTIRLSLYVRISLSSSCTLGISSPLSNSSSCISSCTSLSDSSGGESTSAPLGLLRASSPSEYPVDEDFTSIGLSSIPSICGILTLHWRLFSRIFIGASYTIAAVCLVRGIF